MKSAEKDRTQNGVTYIEKSDVFEMIKSYWWHLYKMGAKKNE